MSLPALLPALRKGKKTRVLVVVVQRTMPCPFIKARRFAVAGQSLALAALVAFQVLAACLQVGRRPRRPPPEHRPPPSLQPAHNMQMRPVHGVWVQRSAVHSHRAQLHPEPNPLHLQALSRLPRRHQQCFYLLLDYSPPHCCGVMQR